MKTFFSVTLPAVAAVLLGCSFPTEACGCSPPFTRIAITGIVLDAMGAPVPAATLTVGRGAPDSCELISPGDQRTVSARTDGTFELTEFLDSPQECRRVQAFPPAGSALSPSSVEFVRLSFDGRQPAPVTLRLLAVQ